MCSERERASQLPRHSDRTRRAAFRSPLPLALPQIKTRMMNQPKDKPLYSGPLDCVAKTVRAEGIGGLYKGFVPAYARLAPHRVVHFVCLEQLNRVFGVAEM